MGDGAGPRGPGASAQLPFLDLPVWQWEVFACLPPADTLWPPDKTQLEWVRAEAVAGVGGTG